MRKRKGVPPIDDTPHMYKAYIVTYIAALLP